MTCLTPPLYLAWNSSMTDTGSVDADSSTLIELMRSSMYVWLLTKSPTPLVKS